MTLSSGFSRNGCASEQEKRPMLDTKQSLKESEALCDNTSTLPSAGAGTGRSNFGVGRSVKKKIGKKMRNGAAYELTNARNGGLGVVRLVVVVLSNALLQVPHRTPSLLSSQFLSDLLNRSTVVAIHMALRNDLPQKRRACKFLHLAQDPGNGVSSTAKCESFIGDSYQVVNRPISPSVSFTLLTVYLRSYRIQEESSICYGAFQSHESCPRQPSKQCLLQQLYKAPYLLGVYGKHDQREQPTNLIYSILRKHCATA
jgi:hypothetical protein